MVENNQASKHASMQACKHASKQASKQASDIVPTAYAAVVTKILGSDVLGTFGLIRELKAFKFEHAELALDLKAVAKPARLLVMLCKYFCVHRPRKQSISKEMNNDNALKFA